MLTCLQSADIEKLLTLLSDPESLLQVAGVGGLSSTIMQRIHSCHRLHFKKIPYISGTMASEGGEVVFEDYDTIEEIGQNWDSMGASFTSLTVNQDPELFTEEQMISARLIKEIYTGENFTRYC